MIKAHDAATSAQKLRAWLFDAKPSNQSEIGGPVLTWMSCLPEETIKGLREEAEQAFAKKREEYRHIAEKHGLDKKAYGDLIKALKAASDEELYDAAYKLREHMRSEVMLPSVEAHSGYLHSKISTLNSNHRIIHDRQKAEVQRLEREAERERMRTAEYALLLAQGRKRRTLQQAYANGDFIPMDDSEEPPLRSSTGHRLRSRG